MLHLVLYFFRPTLARAGRLSARTEQPSSSMRRAQSRHALNDRRDLLSYLSRSDESTRKRPSLKDKIPGFRAWETQRVGKKRSCRLTLHPWIDCGRIRLGGW